MKTSALWMVLLWFSFSVLASIDELPGTIPLEFKRPPATDLLYEGKVLLPHEALNLFKAGIDLAHINPSESDLWKDKGFAYEVVHGYELLNGEDVHYVASVLSRIGNFRFSVFKETAAGRKFYTLMLSKKIHNVLLRSALLKKLGYRIPPIEYLKNIKIAFSSTFEKENFINQMSQDTLGDPKRWIKENQENSKELVLQDLIALGADNETYNLALGYIPASVIKGRRVFNSLLIPYAFTDIPETLNQFSWHLGIVMDKYLRLDYDDSTEFSTPYEDAGWILNRLEKLTVNDFFEIAKSGYFPKEVELLLAHKLIARRNSLMKHFKIGVEALPYDSNISWGEYLVEGKLLKENWEGYASRFAYGDEDSPLSPSELFSYFKSRVLSNTLFNLVNYFNKTILPTIDVQSEVYNRQLSRAFEAYRNYLLNGGSPEPVPVSVYAIPMVSGSLIASREIIAGSYLGTDNVVQLVDAIGANISVGAYLGTDKVAFPWSASGNVSGFLTRTYSHVRPIKSMKKALKTPFKNILIPLHQRKIAHLLDDAIDENLQNPEMNSEERQARLTEILNAFKENLEVGESLIISDSIGAGLGVSASYQMADNLKAYVAGKMKQMFLSRLHILRKDENTIHIYKDLGNLGSIGLSFGINAFIPVLRISVESKKGSSKTKFFSLDINDDLEMNPDIFKNIQALRSLLLKNSLEQVKILVKPYVLKHDFKEAGNEISLLFIKHKGIKSKDFITVVHPEGFQKYFYRGIIGHREGMDYQNTIMDAINAVFREIFDQDDVSVSTQDGINPGDTVYGKSFSRSVIFEGEVKNPTRLDYHADGKLEKSIINIVHRWKGWKMSKQKAQEILARINEKYESELYPEHVLDSTTELELYQVLLFVTFYENAIHHIKLMDKVKVRKIFRTYADRENLKRINAHRENMSIDDLVEHTISSFLYYRKKLEKATRENDLSDISSYTAKMISLAEASLKVKGMMELAGGTKGLFIYSRMEGFRVDDEGGDKPFISSSLGQIGSQDFKGPLFDMQDKIGMTESEFYGYWIQDRL
ncbi:MAG: hypothetical protein A2381_19065 [Bdellovibrionales bacterium RIFOXYB1_FULL_37_110]|nr:MAG: hypothetical protein A2181_09335 [Bdellovibrionales bacterium RIFOXYA1_FULL_38_20]OFZ49482.1 MAG: hypothetical protein A2417_04215 [Bdellovibrionales bacterium RIFOXYC1_FULL_37_79]OFZ58636.1 MAG: hypothetical protein A2381_19065 [Bdellovibrionales bacterium RIFOXYB1_FULL_37_110]OFZ63377.1 MAG: hypothetical protein A2577_17325 [Bdellovibrionales bacterium RIFOXYD1_FULL_36_51]